MVDSFSAPEQPSSRFTSALAALWFCGFAGSVGWWFLGGQQFRRALRGGVPLDLEGGEDIPVPVRARRCEADSPLMIGCCGCYFAC
jgi:hypothetical protein